MKRGPGDTRDAPAARMLVEAEDLAYAYPDGSAALRELSLAVREGERLGILGPNGSGKSTLLRLLGGDRIPNVRCDPTVADPRRRWLAPDQPVFRPWLSGRENAALLLELHGALRAEARTAAGAWLDRFGLAADADRPAGTYSAGMRRRLALSAAFGTGVRLLLLDEPLAGLDPEGRGAFAQALSGHRAAGGTAVFSAHDPIFAAANCDRVAFVVDGRCEVADTPTRLLSGIGVRPRVEIHFAAGGDPDREALGSVPDGVRPTAWSEGGVTLEVEDPGRALPETLGWVLRAGASVASVDVRKPDLGDAFAILTGRRLEEDVR